MQAILKGIYGLYSASSTLKAALPCGLHREMAPQCMNGTDAWATYFVVSGRPEYWFANRYYEVINIQFDIYALTHALRMTAYGALTGVYDNAKPTVTGYRSIIMERDFQQLLRDGDMDQYYRAIVTYDCRFLKT